MFAPDAGRSRLGAALAEIASMAPDISAGTASDPLFEEARNRPFRHCYVLGAPSGAVRPKTEASQSVPRARFAR